MPKEAKAAPRNAPAKATVTKADGKKPPRRSGGRKRDDKEWHGVQTGPNNTTAITAAKKANYLKQLIEPKTEAMINVMEELALGYKMVDGARVEINVHASIRLEAASRLLDRAYGKPKEHMVLEDEGGGSADRDEVTALLNNILESVGAPKIDLDDKTASQSVGGSNDAK